MTVVYSFELLLTLWEWFQYLTIKPDLGCALRNTTFLLNYNSYISELHAPIKISDPPN